MAEVQKCHACGADVPSNAPFGHCPQCLLKLGTGTVPNGAVESAADSTLRTPHSALTEAPGDYIDRYKLLQKIGEGGCGVVYMADQEEPIRRRVALKVIKPGMDTRAVIARFEAERQALAMMDHPNIAKVLDVGQTDTGRPFFVMELVKGMHITEYCDQHNLPTRERLALFTQVCHAIQHAHQKGIIHRDIKPSNILVTLHDGVPVPKVIDFGIAKALHQQRLTDLTLFTAFGQFMGTPAYMSPEQAEMSGLDIDTRCDIYALGVLLYELLVGQVPFDGQQLLQAGLDEMRRIIREQEPVRPSAHLSTLAVADLTVVARHRQCEPARLTHLVRGDLDWIVMKCLEKDRTRRYETANGLAADIQRNLQHEPVIARPASNLYRFQKMVRRNKLAFTAAGAVAAALVIGALVSTVMFFKEQAASRKVTAASTEIARQKSEVELKKAEVEHKNAKLRVMLAEAARSDRLVAEQKLSSGEKQAAFAHLARACEYDPSSTLAAEMGIAALGVWNSVLPTVILAGHARAVWSAQFSPDGTRIVTASDDKTARVWDAFTGKTLVTLAGHEEVVRSAQFSPDGTRIVTASDDRTARVWDAFTGKVLATLAGHEEVVRSAQFSPDGTRIVTAAGDKSARVWDAVTGKTLATLAGHEGVVRSAQFSPDSTRIVTASDDKTARVWDVVTGKTLATLAGHEQQVWNAQFSPDGARIVTASNDRTARVWDAATGKTLATLAGHPGQVMGAQFSSDSTRIVTASNDSTTLVWDAATGKRLVTVSTYDGLSAQFSPDGRRVVTTAQDKIVRVWDPATGKILATLAGHAEWVSSAQFSPDGMRIVTTSLDKTARIWDATIWDATTGQTLAPLTGHKGWVSSAQFSPDGTRIATASFDKTARVWDAFTGQTLATIAGHAEEVYSAQFSLDGTRIVTASFDKTARVWDAATGQRLATLTGHGQQVWCAQFSPDGTRIVTASEDKTARVWDVATGQTLTILAGHDGPVRTAQFGQDGTYIVTASQDKTARIWDATTGQTLAILAGHGGDVRSAEFSLDGTRIITASWDRTARLWDAATGKTLATFVGHKGGLFSAQFSPDGARLVTAANDRTARLWKVLERSVEYGPPPEWFPDFLRYLAQMRLNPDGELETLQAADWLALRERSRAVLRASASADTPYLRILRKFVREN